MKEKQGRKTVLQVVEKIARAKVLLDDKQWPPTCIGILHQPKRPNKFK